MKSKAGLEKLSDEEVMKRAREEAEMFGVLIERYEKKLRRYVRRFAGLSREEAEDVVQEVFMKGYVKMNSFDAEKNFGSWIYRITHNETLNLVRKKKREMRQEEGEEGDAIKLIEGIEAGEDTEAEMKGGELQEGVWRVLDGMRVENRTVLVLRYLEEKSYEEISDIMRKPVGTVGTIIHRAKKEFEAGVRGENGLKSYIE